MRLIHWARRLRIIFTGMLRDTQIWPGSWLSLEDMTRETISPLCFSHSLETFWPHEPQMERLTWAFLRQIAFICQLNPMVNLINLVFFYDDRYWNFWLISEMSAVGLWNNMLQPVGKKATTWHIGEDIICPTKEQPFIFTNKNSN